MKPIYKFNNGRGTTLCHVCKGVITTGKPSNDLYCNKCLDSKNILEEEFMRLKALRKNGR